MFEDYIPEPSILRALRNAPLNWTLALGELIDNAIDAGARHIEIIGRPRLLTVVDDGHGCEDPRIMLRLGAHQELLTTQSGLHGMGGKNVALWLWGKTRITTRHNEVLRSVEVDWDAIRQWSDFAKPQIVASDGRDLLIAEQGTALVYYPTRRVENINKPALRQALQWVFRPALEQGVEITLQYGNAPALALLPHPFPRTVEDMEAEGDINGKRFTLHAGIIDSGESVSQAGFHLIRGPRVIEKTNEPANGYDASRFFAWVELAKDDWMAGLNKNELTDIDCEELFEVLGRLCEPILKKAAEWAEMVSNDAVEHEVTEALAIAHDKVYGVEMNIKARRLPASNPTGPVPPGPDQKKHKRTRRAQSGDKTMATPQDHKQRGRGIWFKLLPLDETQVFKCDRQEKRLTVTFNNKLDLIKALSLEKGKSALKGMAMSASAAYESLHDGDQARFGADAVIQALNDVWMGWQDQVSSVTQEEE